MNKHSTIAPVYLELVARGVKVEAVPRADDPLGYGIKVRGVQRLSGEERQRLRSRVVARKPELLRLLLCQRNEDYEAIREEGAE